VNAKTIIIQPGLFPPRPTPLGTTASFALPSLTLLGRNFQSGFFPLGLLSISSST